MKNWRIVRAGPSGRLEAVPGANFWTHTGAQKEVRQLNEAFFGNTGFMDALNAAMHGQRLFQAMKLRDMNRHNELREAVVHMNQSTTTAEEAK